MRTIYPYFYYLCGTNKTMVYQNCDIMKRLLSLIIIVFASVLMAFGDTFTYNGIKYVTTSSNTVGVAQSNYSDDISIPESVLYKDFSVILK